MSFAGHVFDMIRRNKEDREKLKQLRKHSGQGNYSSRIPDISVEEFEQIQKQTKKREQQEQRYLFRIILLIMGIVVGVLSVLWIAHILA